MARELTERQLELVVFIANGFRPEEIAKITNYSISSVKQTLARARKNADSRTMAHLVAKVIASGLIKFDPEGEVHYLENDEGPAEADPSRSLSDGADSSCPSETGEASSPPLSSEMTGRP